MAPIGLDIRRWLSTRAYPSLSESLSLDALRIAERNRLGIFAAQARANIAAGAQFCGDSDEALKIVRQLLPDLDDLIIYASRDLEYLPLVEGEHGDLAVGLHLGEDLLSRQLAGSHDPGVVSSLCAVVAHLRRLAGEWDRSALAVELAMRSYGHWVNSFVGRLALITRSALWRHQGHPDEAAAQMKHSCDTFWPHGLTDIAMRIMEELAAVALALNRPDDAANLLATARDARTRARKPLSPACRPEVEALQTMLGERRGHPLRQATLRSLAHSIAAR